MYQPVGSYAEVPDPRHAEYNPSLSSWILVTDDPIGWQNDDPIYPYKKIPQSDYASFYIKCAPAWWDGSKWVCGTGASNSSGAPAISGTTCGGGTTLNLTTGQCDVSGGSGGPGGPQDFMNQILAWLDAPADKEEAAWLGKHPQYKGYKIPDRIVQSVPNWALAALGALAFMMYQQRA